VENLWKIIKEEKVKDLGLILRTMPEYSSRD
jgi:hypothetical protein